MTKATASAESGSSARSSDVPSPLDRVTELGNTIVRSFEREGDRLSQWMAHRLAELMDAAAHGRTRADREAAAQQSSDLILRLWQHRHEWPKGWPPGELGTLLERLHELETTPAWQRRWRSPHDAQPSWDSALTELDTLAATERQIAISAALASMDAEEVDSWLHASRAAGEEEELLEQVQRNIEAARRRLSERADPRLSKGDDSQDELDPIALQENALRELVDLTARRAEVFKSVAEARGLRLPRAPRKRAASKKDARGG
jgi:chorismate mutase